VTEQVARVDQEQMERLTACLEQVGKAFEAVVEAVSRLVEIMGRAMQRFVDDAALWLRWVSQEAILLAVLDVSPLWIRFKPWYRRAVERAVERLPERLVGRLMPVALRLEARKWGAA